MIDQPIVVEIWLAWWLRPYCAALAFFCWLTGGEPDPDKLARVVESAVRIREVDR